VALPVNADLAGRARGLAVGADGRLWIAATPAGVIAGVGRKGEEDVRIPVGAGGEPAQPSDVLPRADGLLYATDTTAGKLLRMSAEGRPERSWTVPRANSLDSPHLASDLFGNLYITDPEGGRVEKRDANGEAVGAWELNTLLNRSVKAVGLAVGADGRIWVTDSAGGAVIVIEPES
jgi:streptogramin lyase